MRPFNFVLVAPFLLETVRAGKRDLLCCVMLLLGTFSLALFPAVLLTGYDQYVNAVFDQLTRHVRDDVRPFGLSSFDRFVVILLTLSKWAWCKSTVPYFAFRPICVEFAVRMDQCCSLLVSLRGWVDACEAKFKIFRMFLSVVVGSSILCVCIPAGYARVYAIHASDPSARTDDVGGLSVSCSSFSSFLEG